MSIRVSHVAVLVAVVALLFAGLVVVQPTTLRAERTAKLAGSLSLAQGVLGDVTRLPSWMPWLAGADGSVDGGERAGAGATLTWTGGEARIEAVTPVRTVYRVNVRGSRPDAFRLAVELKDIGTLAASMGYEDEPRGFFGKLMSLFDDKAERVDRQLEEALSNLNVELGKAQDARAADQALAIERAAKAAAAAAARARAAAEQTAALAAQPPRERQPDDAAGRQKRRLERRQRDRTPDTPQER